METPSLLEHEPHEPGLTLLAFSPDGRYIYTGGSDSIARVWDTHNVNNEPDVLGESAAITALASAKSVWFLATVTGEVRAYAHGTTDLRGEPVRVGGALPVNGLAVDPAGRRLAAAADDNEVKIVDVANLNVVATIMHSRGVRRASWHPTADILVSSVSDGSIVVWDLSKTEPKQLAKIDGVLPFISEPEAPGYLIDCSAVWHPNGLYFMVVTRTGDVHAYDRYSWEKVEDKVVLDKTLGPVTAVAISPNGLYVSIAYKSKVIAYSSSSKKTYVEHALEPDHDVTRIAYSPSDDLITWVDKQGYFLRLLNRLPKGWSHPAQQLGQQKSTATSSKKATNGNVNLVDNLWGDDAGEDLGGDDADAQDALAEAEADAEGVNDDFDPIDAVDVDMDLQDEGDRDEHYPREMVSVTKAQPPFQPGATPMENKKRFLAHNTLGVIEVTEMENHNVVNVEFYDKSTRRGYSFQDESRYCFAALGERGAVFANLPEDNSRAHRVTYKAYSTWGSGSSNEWSITLPASERVVAVAAGGVPPRQSMKFASEVNEMEGNGCAIVATSAGFVRFFSGSGLQRYVWAVGGTIVSMVAGSEWVFVVHREGGTSLDGCQNLRFSLVALETFELVQTGPLPLPKRRTLKWIGVTDEGAPAMYDSAGIMFILDRFRRPTQGRWVPILDTNALERRKGKDESYWPVGLAENTFMCLILKGRQVYPTFPRPLLQNIDVHMPLWGADDEERDAKENQFEEQLLRNQLHVTMLADSLGEELVTDDISRREMAMDKELLILLQGACKTTKLQRALELASLLHHAISFDSAIKIATFYNLPGLEERITALKEETLDHDRYASSREERRTWYQHAAPIRAPVASGSNSNDARQELIGFSQPNGHTVRRALAPAAPLSHANPFAKGKIHQPAAALRRQPVEVSSTLDSNTDFGEESFDQDTYDSPPNSGKRKRLEESTPLPDDNREPKRRIMDEPPTKSGNPFARKNTASKPTTLQKDGASFSRAEPGASASASDRLKAKPKEPTKQTTLFGLPAKSAEKKTKAKTKTNRTASEEDTESQTTTRTLLNIVNDTATVEDIADDEPADDNETVPGNQQTESLVVDDDVPIDWDQSPPPSTATLGNDIMVQ